MFDKRTWLARLGVGLNKFKLGETGETVELINNPDEVVREGDALSANNLNDLENRIEKGFLGLLAGHTITYKANTYKSVFEIFRDISNGSLELGVYYFLFPVSISFDNGLTDFSYDKIEFVQESVGDELEARFYLYNSLITTKTGYTFIKGVIPLNHFVINGITDKILYVIEKSEIKNQGYVKFQNGLIIEWHLPQSAGSTNVHYTFSAPFSMPPMVKVSPHQSATSQIQYRSFGYNITNIDFYTYTGTPTDVISWIAIGY